MNKAIITGATGSHHQECLDICRPLFEKYAQKHGYDYIECKLDSEGRPGAWGKIKALLENIDNYEILIWFDVDLIIIDGSMDILSEITPGSGEYNFNMAMVMHETPEGLIPNTGVWLIPKKSKGILKDIWEREDCINECWWDQSALMKLMGYDISIRPVILYNETDLFRDVYWLPLYWNSHPLCLSVKPRINHWTRGIRDDEWRVTNMRADAKGEQFNLKCYSIPGNKKIAA